MQTKHVNAEGENFNVEDIAYACHADGPAARAPIVGTSVRTRERRGNSKLRLDYQRGGSGRLGYR